MLRVAMAGENDHLVAAVLKTNGGINDEPLGATNAQVWVQEDDGLRHCDGLGGVELGKVACPAARNSRTALSTTDGSSYRYRYRLLNPIDEPAAGGVSATTLSATSALLVSAPLPAILPTPGPSPTPMLWAPLW